MVFYVIVFAFLAIFLIVAVVVTKQRRDKRLAAEIHHTSRTDRQHEKAKRAESRRDRRKRK